MWQKARQIAAAQPAEKRLIGAIFWTKGPPHIERDLCDQFTGAFAESSQIIETNITRFGIPIFIAIDLHCVELLPEFAEDVPLISWEDFLKGTEEK